ncbi:OmpA family protein [Ferrovibrio xuzhouensis]|uniref:OmpA family protein n=1 Tax=Ferrovibrio xuzhouensis TaxID=1576914 RepID=A0ABV7VLT5_9PROT
MADILGISVTYRAKRSRGYGLVAALAIAGTVSGCVTTGNGTSSADGGDDNPCSVSSSKYIGAAVGAIAVGTLAYFLSGRKAAPAAVAAVGGGAAGYVIGKDIDDRRCQQWKIAQANRVTVKFDDVVVQSTNSQGQEQNVRIGQVSTWEGVEHFEPGSAKLTPQAEQYFRAVAETYVNTNPPQNLSPQDRQKWMEQHRDQRILLVGHSDDTGSSEANAELSEARARAVGEVFRRQGFNPNRLYYQGAGEKYPIADNRTDDGRAKNRRVEIVEIQSEADLSTYLQNRKPNADFYRVDNSIETASAQTGAIPGSASKGDEKPEAAPLKPVTQVELPSKPVARPKAYEIDFGGVAADQSAGVTVAMLGGQHKGFTQSIASNLGISSAFASDSVFQASCLADKPRVSGEVKRLSDGKEFDYKTTDYAPGLYDTSYGGMANGHLIGLSHVAVLKNETTPVGKPKVVVYKRYKPTDRNKAPDVSLDTLVNVYPGNDALLYRVFIDKGEAPIKCIDLVFPNAPPFGAKYGKVYYEHVGHDFAADFKPIPAKDK